MATSLKVVVPRHGGPEVLSVVEGQLPEPAPGEVRVKVLAAGVSGFDCMYRRWSRLPGTPALPFVLGEDVVGVVDGIGERVDSLELGQTVAGGTWVNGVGGGYAEHVCLPASELVPVPQGVDAAEAVCLVVNYLTAHQHLHHIGESQRGERLLVHGAAGGVGTAVLELGRLAGLEMIGTALPRNHELVSSLGATPIDYRSEDFVSRTRELTGDGVDIVIDPVGGARHLWRSYKVLRRGGRLVWVGVASVQNQGMRAGLLSMLVAPLLRRIPGGKKVPRCPTMGEHALEHPRWYRETLVSLLASLEKGELSPVIAERVPLSEAWRAHEQLERGGHAGKFVLVTDAY